MHTSVGLAVIDFGRQHVITKDTVQIDIDALVYFRITDPRVAVLNIQVRSRAPCTWPWLRVTHRVACRAYRGAEPAGCRGAADAGYPA